MVSKEVSEQMNKMINFMKKKGVFLNPIHSLLERAETIVRIGGHCICDEKRPRCPCSQALEEIKHNHCCFCSLFYDYEGMLHYYDEAWWKQQETKKQQEKRGDL